jgi:hypothetical protein
MATQLLTTYLYAARKNPAEHEHDGLFPFTSQAVAALFSRSNRKPRDVLRKAHGLVEAAAGDNLEQVDEDAVTRYLDALGPDTDDDLGPVVSTATSSSLDWSEG